MNKLYLVSWSKYVPSPLFHYSTPMREVISKDLQAQASLLSIDTDPSLFSELSVFLHDFDSLCQVHVHKVTASPMLPQVQAWLAQKYECWNV